MKSAFILVKRSFDYIGERDYERQCYNVDWSNKIDNVKEIVGYAKTLEDAVMAIHSYAEPVRNGYHRMKDTGPFSGRQRRWLDYEFFNQDGKEMKRIRTTTLGIDERCSVLTDCLW